MSDEAKKIEEELNRIQFSMAHLVACLEPAMMRADIMHGAASEVWKRGLLGEFTALVKSAAEKNMKIQVTDTKEETPK